ncbi:MAG: hypothetical protein WBQ69_09370 [Gallionella sp.]
MAKSVLLARPHPFIVNEMKPFLEQGGFIPIKLEKLANLPANAAGLAGAIISLAVESSVPESAETVFAELRRVTPRTPVLFAAMLSLAAMKGSLRRIAKGNAIEATILGVEPESKDHPDLGKPDTFLYFCNSDFAAPEKRALAAALIKRHFR